MKQGFLILSVVLLAAAPAFSQHRTVAEERIRLQTLLGYAKTGDVPSRHTAHEEMVKFNQWIDADLLSRIPKSSDNERQLFWTVLYDRRCRKALRLAYMMLPGAIERCRDAQITVHTIYELRRRQKKAGAAGNLEEQIRDLRRKVPWNEITLGNEISILVGFFIEFGHERELKKLMTIAIDSSMDDGLAKGVKARRWRTYRDKPLPGGTEMWNTIYTPVWEGVRKLAKRPMDKRKMASVRLKFFSHFEQLAEKKLAPNQKAALQNFEAVRNAMLKTEKHREADEEVKKDDGEGIIRK